jgi:osmotically-inducible protein OsmY
MSRDFLYRGIGVLAIVSAVFAGCERQPAEPETPAVEQAGAVDDETLRTYVQARFYEEDAIRDADIDVAAQNGTVTLSGTVESEQARQRALEIARGVHGVTQVNDELRVADRADAEVAASRPAEGATERPARSPQDEINPAWITTKIQAQYFVNPQIKPWNIEVDTSPQGVVTLRGEVDEAADRQQAEKIAVATEGVTRVVNRLRVRGETPTAERTEPGEPAGVDQPDAWITAKIQSKYFLDEDVKGLDIDVDTDNGVVTLSGVVQNEAARRQAVALAQNTDGVREVNDRLRVEPAGMQRSAEPETLPPGREPQTSKRSTPEAIDDAWITTKIQSKYFLDPDVKGREIDVATSKGVVTLTGTAEPRPRSRRPR